jgi:hypothetical protein
MWRTCQCRAVIRGTVARGRRIQDQLRRRDALQESRKHRQRSVEQDPKLQRRARQDRPRLCRGISRSSRTRWSLAGSSPCPFDELNRQTVVVAWLTPSSRLVKLRGPEGAQRQRATSASEFEFGGTLPERSLVRIREFDPRLPLGCLAQRECALGSGTLGVGSGGRPKRGRRRGLCDALAPAGLNPPLVLWEGACACS